MAGLATDSFWRRKGLAFMLQHSLSVYPSEEILIIFFFLLAFEVCLGEKTGANKRRSVLKFNLGNDVFISSADLTQLGYLL